jgi:hypothetical protein
MIQLGASQGSRESGKDSDSDSNANNDVLVKQPAYAFSKLIDQLRLMAITPPDMDTPRLYIAPHEESNFYTVVNYYFPGMEDFIYRRILILLLLLLWTTMPTRCYCRSG